MEREACVCDHGLERSDLCAEIIIIIIIIIPAKRFDIFPPNWGMLRRFRRVQIFL